MSRWSVAWFRQSLAQAERHVAIGDDHVAFQRRVIAELEADQLDARTEKDLLVTLELVQVARLVRLRQARGDLVAALPRPKGEQL